MANMKAGLINRFKRVAEDGVVMEPGVWRVPRPVTPADHGYEYRAVYAVPGVRVVGFDNERGKDDHCPLHGRELPFTFTTVDALVEDFVAFPPLPPVRLNASGCGVLGPPAAPGDGRAPAVVHSPADPGA